MSLLFPPPKGAVGLYSLKCVSVHVLLPEESRRADKTLQLILSYFSVESFNRSYSPLSSRGVDQVGGPYSSSFFFLRSPIGQETPVPPSPQ